MINNKNKIFSQKLYLEDPRPCKNFYLIQAGESLCPANTVIAPHIQKWFEITFVCSGTGEVSAGSNQTEVKENDCFLSFANEIHTIKSPQSEPLRYIFLTFFAKKGSKEEAMLKKIEEQCKSSDTRRLDFKNEKNILLNILRELSHDDNYSSESLGLLFEQLLISIDRKLSKKGDFDYRFISTDSDALVYDIIEHIDKNILTLKNLADLEKIFYYKLRYLSKIFSRQTGTSLKSYYIGKKMDTARMLLQSGLSVTHVSEILGYSSIHSFSRAYKNYFNDNASSPKK